jgi:UDP-N-acetyl-D-glucosamine dehydrogenase
MKVSVGVVGLGYVGFPFLVACSKKFRNFSNIIGIESHSKLGRNKLSLLRKGILPINIYDGNLINAFKKNRKYLTFADSVKSLNNVDYIFLCLPVDINYKLETNINKYYSSFCKIYKSVKKNCILIITSTVPPGFTNLIITRLKKDKIYNENIRIVYSPERVVPGENYLDSVTNSCRIFSTNDKKIVSKKINFLFKIIFNTKKYPSVELKSFEEAEFAKVLENSYRSINIALMEEWGKLAMDLKINIFDIIKSIKKRPTHNNIMRPGIGVGGYCLTKDPFFAMYSLKNFIKKKNYFQFVDLAMKVNSHMPKFSYKLFKSSLDPNKKKILIIGATYIENVDDARNTPTSKFLKYLKNDGLDCHVYDPVFSGNFLDKTKVLKKNVNFNKYNYIVFLVKHKFVKKINFSKFFKTTKVFDFNNVLSETQVNIIRKKNIFLKILGRGDI